MAEASVQFGARTKYFCHKCADSIFPEMPDFTCPNCHSGFIEELSADDETSAANDVGFTPPAAQFMELWERTFLDNFRDHSGGETSNHHHERAQPPNRIQFMIPPPRRPNRDGPDAASVEFIINHLLHSLTTGGLFPTEGMPLNLVHLHGNPADYAWGTDGLDAIVTQLLNQLEGSGPPPASKGQIEDLPTRNITEADVLKNLQCSVCMDDYKLDEQVRCLPCLHVYHNDCIVPWLQRHGNCPVCRKDMDGKDTTAHIDEAPNGYPDVEAPE